MRIYFPLFGEGKSGISLPGMAYYEVGDERNGTTGVVAMEGS